MTHTQHERLNALDVDDDLRLAGKIARRSAIAAINVLTALRASRESFKPWQQPTAKTKPDTADKNLRRDVIELANSLKAYDSRRDNIRSVENELRAARGRIHSASYPTTPPAACAVRWAIDFGKAVLSAMPIEADGAAWRFKDAHAWKAARKFANEQDEPPATELVDDAIEAEIVEANKARLWSPAAIEAESKIRTAADLFPVAEAARELANIIRDHFPIVGERHRVAVDLSERYDAALEEATTIERFRNPHQVPYLAGYRTPGRFSAGSVRNVNKLIAATRKLLDSHDKILAHYDWTGISDGSSRPCYLEHDDSFILPSIKAHIVDDMKNASDELLALQDRSEEGLGVQAKTGKTPTLRKRASQKLHVLHDTKKLLGWTDAQIAAEFMKAPTYRTAFEAIYDPKDNRADNLAKITKALKNYRSSRSSEQSCK